jgi:hypothetical protein
MVLTAVAVCFSETSVRIYQCARRNIPGNLKTVKNNVHCDVMPRDLYKFTGTSNKYAASIFSISDWGSRFLQNALKFRRDCMRMQ